MAVEYTAPLSHAWARMKRILFSPFDLGKWIVLGFAAFLVDLGDLAEQSGGGSSNLELEDSDIESIARSASDLLANGWETVVASTALILLVGAALVLVLAAWVACQWVSSRGMFMFLDNVVHNRSRIKQPWAEYRAEGNSLFAWRVAFEVITLIIGLLFLVDLVAIFLPTIIDKELMPFSVAALVVLAWVGAVLLVVSAYIGLFLEHFVVPIMYKHRIGVMEAWRRVLALFRARTVELLLYGLFILLLNVIVVVAGVILGLVTCCVAFLVVAIPYVGSVILLPISVTFRSLSVAFLAQFGEDYRIDFEDDATDEGTIPEPPILPGT